MKMKKAILLGLCLINLVTNVRAQVRKDTLVLDDNIQLRMEGSYTSEFKGKVGDECMLDFIVLNGATVTSFYDKGYEILPYHIQSRANRFYFIRGRGEDQMFIVKNGKTTSSVRKSKYKPQYADTPLVMRYLKKGKAYYVAIPIDKLNINRMTKGDDAPFEPFSNK